MDDRLRQIKNFKSQNSDCGQAPIRIEVSRDHLTAYLFVTPGYVPTISEITEALNAEGIVYGIKDEEKISVFISNIELYDHTMIIATGRPFTHGRDASIEYLFEYDDRSSTDAVSDRGRDRIDFKRIGIISSVRRGEPIARKIPAVQGEVGITVYGQELPGEWGIDIHIEAGANVSTSENKREFIAEIDGAPIINNGLLRVDPIHIIESDVDYRTGNIKFDGTVAVKGSIMDEFEVEAAGDIIVENTIQAARVVAGGNIIVKRGILTRGKGLVRAEGSVYAKFIENSVVEAEGNVLVETAILNSSVNCNGRVVALTEEGAIIGGRILASDRIVTRNLGSTAHVATYTQVGYRYEMQRRYINELLKLRAVQAKLNEFQKSYENIVRTGMGLEKLGEIRGKIVQLVRVQKQMQEDIPEIAAHRIFNQYAMIEVENNVYPGSSINIGDTCYTVKTETRFASFKWDPNDKLVYMSSFDTTGIGVSDSDNNPRTVLIIDDSKSVRKSLRMIFERINYRVVDEAEDGEIGIQKYRQFRPSLVTCDISMVNLNGIETLKAIRSENNNAKVIMISSNKDKKKVYDCIANGAADYILKPFMPSKVIAVVNSISESNL